MEKLLHETDAYVRPGPGNQLTLWDVDGNEVWRFPGSWVTDDIFQALRFANWAFGRGCQVGRAEKVREIKRALEVS